MNDFVEAAKIDIEKWLLDWLDDLEDYKCYVESGSDVYSVSHPYNKIWWYSAWYEFHTNAATHSQSAKHRRYNRKVLTRTIICKIHKQPEKFKVKHGMAVQAYLKILPEKKWKEIWKAPVPLDLSHIADVSDDCNPLSFDFEDRTKNLNRRNCLDTARVWYDTQRVKCSDHLDRPCNYFLKRQAVDVRKTIRKLVAAAKRGEVLLVGYLDSDEEDLVEAEDDNFVNEHEERSDAEIEDEDGWEGNGDVGEIRSCHDGISKAVGDCEDEVTDQLGYREDSFLAALDSITCEEAGTQGQESADPSFGIDVLVGNTNVAPGQGNCSDGDGSTKEGESLASLYQKFGIDTAGVIRSRAIFQPRLTQTAAVNHPRVFIPPDPRLTPASRSPTSAKREREDGSDTSDYTPSARPARRGGKAISSRGRPRRRAKGRGRQ